MTIEKCASKIGMRKSQFIFNFLEWINKEAQYTDIFYISDEVFDKLLILYYNSLRSGLNK